MQLRCHVQRLRDGLDPATEWDDRWFAGLQRKYRTNISIAAKAPFGRGLARDIVGLAFDILPVGRGIRASVARVFDALGLASMPNGPCMDACKALGTVAKRHGPMLFGRSWMFLVDWNLCFGSAPHGTEDFADQLGGWVSTEKPEDKVGSLRRTMVEHGLGRLFCRSLILPRQLGVDEFLRSPSVWLVNGSSTGKRLRGSRGTKFSTYLASTTAELSDLLLDASSPDYVVLEKRERGKLRNLVTSPWSLHLQMSYLCQGLEEGLDSLFPTTLSNRVSKLTRWKCWRSMIRSKIGVPIDQSTFDHVPWMDLIIDVCSWLAAQGRKASPDVEHHDKVSRALLHRLRRARVHWQGHTWAHLRGLLSGWRWTSGLGTIINYVEFLGVVWLMGMPEPPRECLCFQGDDLLAFVDSWAAAYAMVRVYMHTLPVNPKKFFVDEDRTEFLRYVLTPSSRMGYLVRAVPSVVYANAWAGGKMSARSTAEQWSQLVGRGADLRRCRDHLVRDLCGMVRCQRADVEDLLRTPKAAGGLGMELVRAYDAPIRWLKLLEQEHTGEAWEKRRTALTDVARVPKDVLAMAEANMRTRGGALADAEFASGAAVALLESVEGQGWKASADQRSVLVATQVIRPVVYVPAPVRHARPPDLTVDTTFARSIISKLLPGGWEKVKEIIDPRHRLWAHMYWRSWSRNVWVDWVTGSLKASAHAAWGLASEIQSEMQAVLDSRSLLHHGKVTRMSVMRNALRLELHSLGLLPDEKSWVHC